MLKRFLATTYLLLINYCIQSVDITYYYFYESEFQIVLNIDKFYFIFKDVLSILSGLFLFYFTLYRMNDKVEKKYLEFKKRNPNLMPTKTNYFLWIQLIKTIYTIHDFSMAILMFIALVQYSIVNKKINMINYILLNIFALVQNVFAWYQDIEIHRQNKSLVRVNRNNTILTIPNSQIREGDMLILSRGETIRVKEAINSQKLVVFSLGQTGEEINEEYKVNSKIAEGLVVVNHDTEMLLKVTKTFSESKLVEDDVNTVKEINEKSTKLALCIIISFAVFIYFCKILGLGNHNIVLDIVDLLLDIIGCFIGLNYLIPSFKIQQSMNLFDSVCRFVCQTKYQFKISNHGDIDVMFSPDDTEIVFDKTGTLTDNKLTIEKCYLNEYDQKRTVCFIAAHINSIYHNKKHTSHSPETNVISDYLLKNYNLEVGENYKWTDEEQMITMQYGGEKIDITRYVKCIYNAKNLGSHSLIKYEDRLYHIFMGQKALLYEYLNYSSEKVYSKKRGMVIGYIRLKSLEEFKTSLDCFRNKGEIEEYTILGEFHFNNYYRKHLDNERLSCCFQNRVNPKEKSTQSGINGLKGLGYRVHMITGDALITAEDIAKELEILDEKTEVINGEEFMKKSLDEQDEILSNVFSRKGNVIFGRTKAEYKGHIVERFQKCGKKVIYGGDQENDYHAIQKANIGLAQENGNKKCKNIANLEGEIPTETIYKYLSKYRTLGIEGKAWFYKELIRFNYITSGVWLVGITTLGFEKMNLLFIDPWSALMSLMMSIGITLLCMYRAFRMTHKKMSSDEIVYETSIKSLCKGLIGGYLLFMTGLKYETYSIPLITCMMIMLR